MADENKNKKEEATAEKTAEETKEEATAPDTAKEDASAGEASATDGTDEGADVEVPEKFKALVEQVESMTVLELNELVKLLEKKFGVSAAAVAVAASGAGASAEAEEKSEFTVHLASVGDQKIAVIKAVKEVLGLGLKEAKDLVDSAPAELKAGVKKDQAEEWKEKIEAAGGKVELK